jgi:hypothetical protein
VVDGKPQGNYAYVQPYRLKFSKDGRRLAYVARIGAKDQLIIDGRIEYTSDEIYGTCFSPNGASWACNTRHDAGKKAVVVIDGKRQRAYDEVAYYKAAWAFDHVGRTFAYTARLGGVWAVVVGDQESPSYNRMVALTSRSDGCFEYLAVRGLELIRGSV